MKKSSLLALLLWIALAVLPVLGARADDDIPGGAAAPAVAGANPHYGPFG